MRNGTGRNGTGTQKRGKSNMNKAGLILITSTAILILIIYMAAIIGTNEPRRRERTRHD